MSKKRKNSKKKVVDTAKVEKHGKVFWEEFQAFAMQGNVIDLAVGVIIGTAFNAIVQSLVKDIVMPVFGWLLNGTAFNQLYFSLSGSYESLEAAQAAGAPLILYGVFISRVVDFLIISLTVFVVLKYVMKKQMKKS